MIRFDFWMMLELAEILCILWYLLTTKDGHDDTSTQLLLAFLAVMIAYDVFILQRHRPDVFRDAFNAGSLLICYEKLFKKYVRVAVRKLGM